MDQLARLHREMRQTNRWARFLASSVHAAFLFMVMAMLVFFLGRTETIGRDFSWALMILVGVLALLHRYIRAQATLFSGAPLAQAAKELRLVFLYMGFAWGAGAFLVLPADPAPLAAVLFAAFPSMTLAFVLADSLGFMLFLIPTGLLATGAALMRGFPHAALDICLILILQWGLFRGALLRNREPHPAVLSQG